MFPAFAFCCVYSLQLFLVPENLPLKIGSCQVKQFGILECDMQATVAAPEAAETVAARSDTSSGSDYHYRGDQPNKQQSTAVKDLAPADESA